MADRFFLFSKDDGLPLVELLGLTSSTEFVTLVGKMGEDPALASEAWGMVVDDDVPDDARSVSVREVGLAIGKALMRRLLQYETPLEFIYRDDPENLRMFLHRVWEV